MPSISIEGLPSAAPAADSWPRNELGDDSPLGLQADEMFARQLDTGFAGEVRGLVNDPATGLAGRDPEPALAGIAGTIPLLAELKDRYLAQAIGPRQKAMLESLIDRRLDRAGGELGRIAAQATSLLDDRIVAERIAELQQDASLAWHDPAHLRTPGATAVGELRYQGERKGWDASRTDTVVRTGLSDLYAGAVEAALGQDPERAAKLYDHAREVIQPERQAAVERKIDRAREERRVTEIVGGLADTPDDPARRPDPDDYQARATEATPPDASPEVRAQISRMASIEQARADRAWQASRARTAQQRLDRLLGAFEPVEGKPPTMADIRGLVGDVVRGMLPRVNGDPNIVRTSGGEPVEADGDTQIAPPQETLAADNDVQIAQQEEAQNRQPTSPQSGKPSRPKPPTSQQSPKPPLPKQPPPQSAASAREPGRGYGKIPQAQIEKGMTLLQIRINRDQAFRELTRQPLTPKQVADGSPLPDDWETTKPADIVDAIKRAAERHGVPTQMFARLLYQEGKFNEKDKLREPLVMDSDRRFQAIGYAQMNKNTLEDLLRRARARGDDARAKELETYSLGNFRQAFDAAAENLALNYKLTGGSWPKAVAAYNVGANDMVTWFNGGKKDPIDFSTPAREKTKKWGEMSAYLAFVLRGSDEDPRTGDMYTFDPSRLGRTREPISRPGIPSDIRKNP